MKRRDRRSTFTIRKLGQLIALRVYQTNLSIISLVPKLNTIFIFRVLKYIFEGFKLLNRFAINKISCLSLLFVMELKQKKYLVNNAIYKICF